MSLKRQCAAPVQQGSNHQCPNDTVDANKLHCKDHIKKARKLYDYYKKICNEVTTFSIEAVAEIPTLCQKMEYLNRFYCLLMRAYEGREKHRTFGFVPKLFDKGHDLQFVIILDNTATVERELSKVYAKMRKQNKKLTKKPVAITNEKQDKTKLPPISTDMHEHDAIIAKMKEFKQRRLQDEKLVQETLRMYTLEHVQNEKTIKKMMNFIKDALISLLKGCEVAFKLYGFIRIMDYLIREDYFEKDYKPSYCEICRDCGSFQSFKILFFTDTNQIKHSIDEYLVGLQLTSLCILHGLLSHKRHVLKPIANDYATLLKSYGMDLLLPYTDVCLTYNPKLKRLHLYMQDRNQIPFAESDDEYTSDDRDDDGAGDE